MGLSTLRAHQSLEWVYCSGHEMHAKPCETLRNHRETLRNHRETTAKPPRNHRETTAKPRETTAKPRETPRNGA